MGRNVSSVSLMMNTRYPLRNTLYRVAPKVEQVRMSGATAQKIRMAGGNTKFGRGSEEGGNGVRVGQRMLHTLAHQLPLLSPGKSTDSQSRTTRSSDQQTSTEGELSSSSDEERNSRVGTVNKTYPTIARPHPSYAGWGSLISEENWVKPSLSSVKLSLATRGR